MNTITVFNSGTKPLGFRGNGQPVALRLGENPDVPVGFFVQAMKKPKSALLAHFHHGALRLDSDEFPLQVQPPRKVAEGLDEPDMKLDPRVPHPVPTLRVLHTTQRPCPTMEQFLIKHGVLDVKPVVVLKAQAEPDSIDVAYLHEHEAEHLGHAPMGTEPEPVEVAPAPALALDLDAMGRAGLREFLTKRGVEFDGRASKATLLGLAKATPHL